MRFVKLDLTSAAESFFFAADASRWLRLLSAWTRSTRSREMDSSAFNHWSMDGLIWAFVFVFFLGLGVGILIVA